MADEVQVLCVGDTVIDAFIKLQDDQAWVEERDGNKVLAMPYGMKVPFQNAIVIEGVGNAANAAVSFTRLGVESGLVTNVGADKWGRDIIDALEHHKVDTRFVHINKGKVSNYHYVLWYKDERTILIKHEEYKYHWPHFRKNDIPDWIYLSSIAKGALESYHDEVADFMKDHPQVKLAFQPGTFQMAAGAERLKDLYRHTEILFLNREEAVIVGGGDHANMHDLFDKLHALGPKHVVITDGPQGAYASDGKMRYSMPNYPDPGPPVERTGAGDSFASTYVAALINGADTPGALLWAPINSMSVVQHVGAQEGLLSEPQITKFLREAPEWYHPKVL
jgi:ribokinase